MAYVINDECISCGACEGECPVSCISAGDGKYEINDIIIRQDGQVFCDWDFTNKTLLPTQLLHDGMRELMARSREKMVEIATTPEPSCGGVGGCGGYYVDLYSNGCGGRGFPHTPRLSCGGGGTCGGGMGCGGYGTCG